MFDAGVRGSGIFFNNSSVTCTPVGNTATITGDISGAGPIGIYWRHDATETEETGVKGCIINVNDVNSTQNMTITPEITISGGSVYYDNDNAISNTVKISNVTFENLAHIYGGYSMSGTVNDNQVIISGGTVSGGEIYGGHSLFGTNSTANKNKVSINGGTFWNGTIYGGKSDFGTASENSVSISSVTNNSYFYDVYGGFGTTAADGNIVSISSGQFHDQVHGGYGKTAYGNSVIISGGKFYDYVYGGHGNTAADGNIVSISGGTVTSFVYGGFADSDSDTANGNPVTANDNSVIISGGNFVGQVDVRGGYSPNGTANKNIVSISGGNFNGHFDFCGGYSESSKANGNIVSISDSTINGQVCGGYAQADSGEANENKVIIRGGTVTGFVYGGYSESGKANDNQVIISGGTIDGSVCGGLAITEAKDNRIVLLGNNANYIFTDTQGTEQTLTGSGINITGAVGGGYVENGTHSGNKIHVYGSNTKVGYIAAFEELHFFIDNTLTFGETMLTINGMSDTQTYDTDTNDPPNVTISKDNLAVKVTGKPKASGDKNTITLIHNESDKITYSDNITSVPVEIGELLTGEGSVALVTNENSKEDLILTLNVEKTTVNENGKSLVETRAAAAFVVNNMSDFMLGTGMEQAKAAAGGVTPIDEGKLTPFAAVGGSNMRYTTGSYVDVNGWNGVVGFAKQADKLLFGVAVEHGRGNYDSYLDNGVHASGDIKSTGGVIFGEYKLDNGVHYDAALRAGRVKSDYNSTATSYDESSTYYGFSLGGGKELTVSDKATLDVYGRYYFSHTNGSDVSIATGEEIDFDAVNSHRLRIGGRYTTTLTEKSKAYAGLAWQYEFGGDAKAAINGYSAPTPSLQGHSAIVEAGYKLNAGKNLTLDFNLNGAMGKQRGIGGGIGAQWLF